MNDTVSAFLEIPGPHGLRLWQWLGLPLLIIASWLGGALLSRLTRLALGAITRRTVNTWDDNLLAANRTPLTWAWTTGVAYLLSGQLHLSGGATATLHTGLRTGLFATFFWMLLKLVTVSSHTIASSSFTDTHATLRSLVPLGTRIVRVAVVGIGVVAILADLGYPVASLVAGLGIGGLALALAAQKTVENLFGAFALGGDQPFRVGDVIKVDGTEGTVEALALGLRSTRLRTADRSLVSLPNGKLADMRIESMSARDRMRLHTVLPLGHATTPTQAIPGCGGKDALCGYPG